MMEYFDTLLRANEWDKALKYAEQLLRDRAISELEVVRVYCGLCEVRHHLKDYEGSVVAGKLALEEAMRLRAFDQYGIACLALSATHLVVSDLQASESVLIDFLHHLDMYSEGTRNYEAHAWFNLGRTYMMQDNGAAAARAYADALRVAGGRQSPLYVLAVRQSLIEAYLKTRDLRPIPLQLARCAVYLRHASSEDEGHRSCRLVHLRLRVEYAMASDRLRRGQRLALAGLAESEGLPRHQFTFHMLLARMSLVSESTLDAVGHSQAARAYAMQCHRVDLETEAAEFTYDIVNRNPGILEGVDRYYLGV